MMDVGARLEAWRDPLFGAWNISSKQGLIGIDSAVETIRWRDQSSEFLVSEVKSTSTVHYRLRLGELAAVDILPERKLVAMVEPGMPDHTLDHFLTDQIIPRVMAHEGSFILHAGAVAMNGGAILILGPSGRGKSTLSSSFDQAGCALLGDDAMIISSTDDGPCVKAVYPSLRLMPDSIDALFSVTVSSTAVAHYSAKRRVSMPTIDSAGAQPLPILAIFVLAAPAVDSRIALRPLTVAESCMAFVENSFALDPSDSARARERLADASALAGQVPTFLISYPRNYSLLPEVRRVIFDHVAALELP